MDIDNLKLFQVQEEDTWREDMRDSYSPEEDVLPLEGPDDPNVLLALRIEV